MLGWAGVKYFLKKYIWSDLATGTFFEAVDLLISMQVALRIYCNNQGFEDIVLNVLKFLTKKLYVNKRILERRIHVLSKRYINQHYKKHDQNPLGSFVKWQRSDMVLDFKIGVDYSALLLTSPLKVLLIRSLKRKHIRMKMQNTDLLC